MGKQESAARLDRRCCAAAVRPMFSDVERAGRSIAAPYGARGRCDDATPFIVGSVGLFVAGGKVDTFPPRFVVARAAISEPISRGRLPWPQPALQRFSFAVARTV